MVYRTATVYASSVARRKLNQQAEISRQVCWQRSHHVRNGIATTSYSLTWCHCRDSCNCSWLRLRCCTTMACRCAFKISRDGNDDCTGVQCTLASDTSGSSAAGGHPHKRVKFELDSGRSPCLEGSTTCGLEVGAWLFTCRSRRACP